MTIEGLSKDATFVFIDDKTFTVEDLTELLSGDNEHIPIIVDENSLSNFLGIQSKTLWWARINKNNLYKTFKIPKKNKKGKTKFRHLCDPEQRLKYIQKQIANKILSKFELPEYITGFRKGVSIVDTAKIHAGKKIVMSLDIENFFPSIKQWHVNVMLRMLFKYPDSVNRLISELVTFHNFVPQGAPTSPIISNLVSYAFFDKEVKELSDKYQLNYTRYADDLTFSTNKDYPKLSEPSESNPNIPIKSELDDFVNSITLICKKHGFKINKYKTKYMRGVARKWVLGTVVNKEPNILRYKYNIIRAILHNINLNGLEKEASKTGRTKIEFISWVKGLLLFLKQVNPQKGGLLLDDFNLILKADNGSEEDITEVKLLFE